MVASIGIGQLIAKTGKYKRFVVIGFALASACVFGLTTLQPDSPYWHEAILMAMAGLGLGMSMPILTLAIQNEFSQKDLGSATASVQLSRGLGSTIGTAVMSGVLTLGIANYMGSADNHPYLETLRKSPASSQFMQGEVTADTMLQLNLQKSTIAESFEKSIAKSHLPPEIVKVQTEKFLSQQVDFSNQVIEAFTRSLHNIFLISSLLMAVALILSIFIKEKELRDQQELNIE